MCKRRVVDVAAGACHKWLLTSEGVGFLYLSDRARERIQPTLVGWISVPEPDDYANFSQGWNRGTLAWETGTGPMALIHGLEQSLKLLSETGIERIQGHLETLTDYLCECLANRPYRIVSSRQRREKSQIVCIQHTSGLSAMNLYSHLKDKNIIAAPRGDRLRISPHLLQHCRRNRCVSKRPSLNLLVNNKRLNRQYRERFSFA